MGANRLGTLNKDAFSDMMVLNELYAIKFGPLLSDIRNCLLTNSQSSILLFVFLLLKLLLHSNRRTSKRKKRRIEKYHEITVAATHIYNYMINDHLVDWLKVYKKEVYNRDEFTDYICNKGKISQREFRVQA